VADDVVGVELDEREVVDAFQDAAHREQTRAAAAPVTTILEPNPRRVRNIFICSGVVFCASSRMMKESLSVRPRMNASGATSMVPRSISRDTASGSSMS
jgi:hypothetical protein